jgi:hypothetical protein
MPEISRFFGIVIAMYHRDHPPAHFHARYGDHEATFSIETGRMTEGSLPRRTRSFVQQWHRLHVEELRAAWQAVQARMVPNKIDPLE